MTYKLLVHILIDKSKFRRKKITIKQQFKIKQGEYHLKKEVYITAILFFLNNVNNLIFRKYIIF